MAKQKSGIVVRRVGGNQYDVWMDEEDADKVEEIDGVYDVSGQECGEQPWLVTFDPRYDAAEVIAEIEALGEEKKSELWNLSISWQKEEKPQGPFSLSERARALGREAGRSEQLIFAVREVLEGAEEVYGETYESALSTLIGDIVSRLWQGGW